MELRFRNILVIFAILSTVFIFWNDDKESESVVSVEDVVEDPGVFEAIGPELTQSEAVPATAPPTQPKKSPSRLKPVQASASPKAKYPNLDSSFVAFDEQGNRYIEQINQVGPHLVYHGDVLLGDSSDLEKFMKTGVVKKGRARKWPNGKIPYVIDDSVVQYDRVIEAIEYLNTFTHLKIVPRESEKDYVLITRGESDCYSYAGRVGGKQEIFLVPQCNVREILHEWMHTIGFFHEQNREDRDRYLTIVWDNIDKVNKPQFKKMPNDFIGLVGRPFDYQSIMLYNSYTFSVSPQTPAMLTVDGDIIPPTQNLLSDEDISRVNKVYPSIE